MIGVRPIARSWSNAMLAIDYLKSVKLLDRGFAALPIGVGDRCVPGDLLDEDVQRVLADAPGKPLFGVSEEVLRRLAEHAWRVHAPRGTLIQEQWGIARDLTLVLSGQITILHVQKPAPGEGPQEAHAQVVETATAGDAIGQSEFLLDGVELNEAEHGVTTNRYRATALVTQDAEIISCRDASFIRRDPEALQMVVNLGARVALSLYERHTAAERLEFEERVRRTLVNLVQLRELQPFSPAPQWYHFAPRLSVDDVKRLTGGSKESVRLALRRLTGWDHAGSGAFVTPEASPFGWARGRGVLVSQAALARLRPSQG